MQFMQAKSKSPKKVKKGSTSSQKKLGSRSARKDGGEHRFDRELYRQKDKINILDRSQQNAKRQVGFMKTNDGNIQNFKVNLRGAVNTTQWENHDPKKKHHYLTSDCNLGLNNKNNVSCSFSNISSNNLGAMNPNKGGR
jgi:hypothetical protein